VLRRKVLGHWTRADSDRITLMFHKRGRLTGTGFWAPSPGTDEVGDKMADDPFQGRWKISGGWLLISMGRGTLGWRIDMPDEDTIRLYGYPERIDHALVYHRA
jgi:hypothetical protein